MNHADVKEHKMPLSTWSLLLSVLGWSYTLASVTHNHNDNSTCSWSCSDFKITEQCCLWLIEVTLWSHCIALHWSIVKCYSVLKLWTTMGCDVAMCGYWIQSYEKISSVALAVLLLSDWIEWCNRQAFQQLTTQTASAEMVRRSPVPFSLMKGLS